jgi:hypothetical protein
LFLVFLLSIPISPFRPFLGLVRNPENPEHSRHIEHTTNYIGIFFFIAVSGRANCENRTIKSQHQFYERHQMGTNDRNRKTLDVKIAANIWQCSATIAIVQSKIPVAAREKRENKSGSTNILVGVL